MWTLSTHGEVKWRPPYLCGVDVHLVPVNFTQLPPQPRVARGERIEDAEAKSNLYSRQARGRAAVTGGSYRQEVQTSVNQVSRSCTPRATVP